MYDNILLSKQNDYKEWGDIVKRKKLKIRRIEKDLSQIELAKRVGVTNQSISDYETGRVNPSFSTMERIARELDSTVDELFFNTA